MHSLHNHARAHALRQMGREKHKRKNATALARKLQAQIDGKKGKSGLNSFMQNDQEKWITDLKSDNVRLKRENAGFMADMEAQVQKHLDKTQAQLVKDTKTMRAEIATLHTQEVELQDQVH